MSDPQLELVPPPSSPSFPSVSAPGESEGIDFWRMYSALTKRLWLVGAVFVATVTCVAFWTFRQVRIYRAEATVLIDLNAPEVLKGVPEVVQIGAGGVWSTKEYFETQYRILRSRSIAEKVV